MPDLDGIPEICEGVCCFGTHVCRPISMWERVCRFCGGYA